MYKTELKVMRRLRNPNFVRVFDIFVEEITGGHTWDRRCSIWIEMAKSDLARIALSRQINGCQRRRTDIY